jgi:hypothetical protein
MCRVMVLLQYLIVNHKTVWTSNLLFLYTYIPNSIATVSRGIPALFSEGPGLKSLPLDRLFGVHRYFPQYFLLHVETEPEVRSRLLPSASSPVHFSQT